MGTNSESFCNVAGFEIHIPLMHRNAFVTGGFHRHVDVNATARPFGLSFETNRPDSK
jgi:hypothetical protein